MSVFFLVLALVYPAITFFVVRWLDTRAQVRALDTLLKSRGLAQLGRSGKTGLPTYAGVVDGAAISFTLSPSIAARGSFVTDAAKPGYRDQVQSLTHSELTNEQAEESARRALTELPQPIVIERTGDEVHVRVDTKSLAPDLSMAVIHATVSLARAIPAKPVELKPATHTTMIVYGVTMGAAFLASGIVPLFVEPARDALAPLVCDRGDKLVVTSEQMIDGHSHSVECQGPTRTYGSLSVLAASFSIMMTIALVGLALLANRQRSTK